VPRQAYEGGTGKSEYLERTKTRKRSSKWKKGLSGGTTLFLTPPKREGEGDGLGLDIERGNLGRHKSAIVKEILGGGGGNGHMARGRGIKHFFLAQEEKASRGLLLTVRSLTGKRRVIQGEKKNLGRRKTGGGPGTNRSRS